MVTALLLSENASTLLSLNCTSTGSPASRVVWLKNLSRLNFDDGPYNTYQVLVDGSTATYENTLTGVADPRELEGTYTCIVFDSENSTSQPAEMEVEGIYKTRTVIVYIHTYSNNITYLQIVKYNIVMPDNSVQLQWVIFCLTIGLTIGGYTSARGLVVGEDATITCSSDLNGVIAEWLFHNVVAVSSDGSAALEFLPVRDALHGDQYTCRINSSYKPLVEDIVLLVDGMSAIQL